MGVLGAFDGAHGVFLHFVFGVFLYCDYSIIYLRKYSNR
nr:MAG TPA: hypothetical protein [Caudoviricetes sp.]